MKREWLGFLAVFAIALTILIFVGTLKPPLGCLCCGFDQFPFLDYRITDDLNLVVYLSNLSLIDKPVTNVSATLGGDLAGGTCLIYVHKKSEFPSRENSFELVLSTTINPSEEFDINCTQTFVTDPEQNFNGTLTINYTKDGIPKIETVVCRSA